MPRTLETAGQGSVWSLAGVRLDGRALIARGGADGVVRFLDVEDGTEVTQIEAHQGPVRALVAVLGPDGPTRVATGGLDGYVRLWDLGDPSGNRRVRFHDEVSSLASLTLDGRVVLAGTGPAGTVELWEPRGESGTQVLTRTSGRAWAVAPVTVAGRELLAVGGADGAIELLDPRTAEVVRTIRAHQSTVWTLTAVPSGGRDLLASGGADALVCLWDPATGELVRRFTGHLSTIRAMAVVTTPDGPRLATGSADSTIRVWPPESTVDEAEHVFSDNSGEIWALAPVEGGDGLLAGGGAEGTVFLYDPTTHKAASLLSGSGNTVWALCAVDLGGHAMLASGGVEGPVSVIDMDTRTVERMLRGHRSTVRALTTVDGTEPDTVVASAGADSWVRLWDVRGGAEIKQLRRAHVGEVWALTSFRDGTGRYVASGGTDGKVRVWPVHGTGIEPVVVGEHDGEVQALASVPSPDGPVVASAGPGAIRLWDGLHGGARGVFRTDAGTVWALAAYPYGTGWRIAAALASGTVATFDPQTLAHTGDFTGASGSSSVQVRALVWARVEDRVLLIGGCQDGSIHIWDTATRGLVARLPAHTGTVRALAVAYVEGRPQLASAGDDGDVRQHGLADLSDEGKIRVSARPATQIASDRPSLIDTVGRGAFVDALYDFLTDEHTSPPVVVGVHGPWGHGKSSVLTQLRRRLDPRSQASDPSPSHRLEWRERGPDGRYHWVHEGGRLSPRWAQRRLAAHTQEMIAGLPARLVPRGPDVGRRITVWFSPWMYHSRDEMWAGLSQEIIKAVTGRLDEDDQRRLWFELNLRRSDPLAIRRRLLLSFLPRTPGGLLLALAGFAVAVLGLLTEADLIGKNPQLAALFVGLPALGLLGKLLWSMFQGSVAGVLPPAVFSGPSSGGLDGASPGGTEAADPLHESRAGYLYLVQHDIEQIVGLANQDTPIVIFIDDLDRCSSDMITDTIEAINLFVNNAFGDCNFVIALDPATIAAHVEARHDGLMRRIAEAPVAYGVLGDVGWRFMEKIIDLPIRLPRPSAEAIAAYTHTLLATPRHAEGTPALVGSPVVPEAAEVPGPVRPGGRGRRGTAGQLARGLWRSGASGERGGGPGVPPRLENANDGAGTGSARATTDGLALALADPPTPDGDGPGNGRAGATVLPAQGRPDTVSAPAGTAREAVSAADAAAAVAAVESIPEVSELVRLAALGLPRRSPRETKRFLNMWRFYLSLEYRQNRLAGDRAELALTARSIAQFVEVLLRWPKYLNRLAEPSGGRPALAGLVGSADDPAEFHEELARVGLEAADPDLEALRRLLVLCDEEQFAAIAERYL